MENLKVCTDSAHEVDFGSGRNRSVLSKQHYRELEKVLNYKLELAGLSKPVKVSPFGIFSTCPKCGLNTKKSRSSKGMFLCISCGSAYHVRNLGSINLANKLIKYNQDDIRIKVVKEEEGIRLCNDILGVEPAGKRYGRLYGSSERGHIGCGSGGKGKRKTQSRQPGYEKEVEPD